MKVIGYSERGVVNSLFYEMSYRPSPKDKELLGDFVGHMHFPFSTCAVSEIREATVLVEQSLSDFGDSDAIILLDTDKGPLAIFIEAKVKRSQSGEWGIDREFRAFRNPAPDLKNHSSNLFTQLYYKLRFANGLREDLTNLEKGLSFSKQISKKETRRIGKNPVVRRAVEEKIGPFLENTRYVALVPDQLKNVEDFFENTLKTSPPEGYREWDVSHYGFLCWSEVEDFCKKKDLGNTLEVFEYNRGQVYKTLAVTERHSLIEGG